MTTKKKTTRKRRTRKVTEQHNYTVKTTKDVAGDPQETEKTVNAPNAQQAVTKSMQGDAQQGRYDSVEVSKGGTGAGEPNTQSNTQSQTTANTTGMAGLESAEYPYSLGLPNSYLPLVESLTKKMREALSIHTKFGRVHITVPDSKVMETFMGILSKKARGRTAVKSMAGVIYHGINESVNK
jgi:hypothetical protein